jgi:hypothetical protein
VTTTVTSSIGTGGTYSTVAAWFAACPASLVTADQIWRGECKNQTLATVNFAGITTSSTQYVELTTEAGASFVDNATKVGRVDSTKGAVLRTTASYTAVITLGSVNDLKISKLQVEIAGAVGGSTPAITNAAGSTNVDINQCIVEGSRSNVVSLYGNNVIRNSIVTCRGSGMATIATIRAGATAINCTFAVPSDKTAATNGITGQYSTSFLKNCAIFGCTNLATGTAATYTTCATSATGTTGVTGGVAHSTSTFVGTVDASRDFRLVSGSALLDVGTTDSTNAANDIYGTARPQGSAYDIGAFELVVASGNSIAVPAGSLTLTGLAPTVSQTANNAIAVPAGTLTLTGLAPTVTSGANQTVAVPLGTLTMTGLAPTVNATANQSIAVPAGALTLTGLAPTVTSGANQTIAVPVGTLSLAGFAPSIAQTANNVIAVPAGTLALQGYAPTITGGTVTPDASATGGWYLLPSDRARLRKLEDDERESIEAAIASKRLKAERAEAFRQAALASVADDEAFDARIEQEFQAHDWQQTAKEKTLKRQLERMLGQFAQTRQQEAAQRMAAEQEAAEQDRIRKTRRRNAALLLLLH